MFYSKHIFLCGKIGTALNITASGMFLRKNWKISKSLFQWILLYIIIIFYHVWHNWWIVWTPAYLLLVALPRPRHNWRREEEWQSCPIAILATRQSCLIARKLLPSPSCWPAACSQVATSAGIHCKRENGPGNHFKPCKASQTSLTAQEHQCPPSQNALQWEQVVNQNRILFISKQL